MESGWEGMAPQRASLKEIPVERPRTVGQDQNKVQECSWEHTSLLGSGQHAAQIPWGTRKDARRHQWGGLAEREEPTASPKALRSASPGGGWKQSPGACPGGRRLQRQVPSGRLWGFWLWTNTSLRRQVLPHCGFFPSWVT